MAKCDKCGRNYTSIDTRIVTEGKSRRIPQPKQGCPSCDKEQNKKNSMEFMLDMMNRSQNPTDESNFV